MLRYDNGQTTSRSDSHMKTRWCSLDFGLPLWLHNGVKSLSPDSAKGIVPHCLHYTALTIVSMDLVV